MLNNTFDSYHYKLPDLIEVIFKFCYLKWYFFWLQ